LLVFLIRFESRVEAFYRFCDEEAFYGLGRTVNAYLGNKSRQDGSDASARFCPLPAAAVHNCGVEI
jgi:hypothetical protein